MRYGSVYTVKAGKTFDGDMKTNERSGLQCKGQKEGGAKDAVFKLEPGATLRNVLIGANQTESEHCDQHDCTLQNVWNEVCEDAFSVKGGSAGSVTASPPSVASGLAIQMPK